MMVKISDGKSGYVCAIIRLPAQHAADRIGVEATWGHEQRWRERGRSRERMTGEKMQSETETLLPAASNTHTHTHIQKHAHTHLLEVLGKGVKGVADAGVLLEEGDKTGNGHASANVELSLVVGVGGLQLIQVRYANLHCSVWLLNSIQEPAAGRSDSSVMQPVRFGVG